MAAAVRRRRNPRWASWPDEKLLDLRFCDLGLSWRDGPIEAAVRTLHDELGARGLKLRPHVWLSTEWFSPDRIPGIAVPFYLAHPRLLRLERSLMLEAEGGTREECMMILRHEAGHCAQHAWRLHLRAEWKRQFGDASRPYPEVYRPNPASQKFVQHLRQYYAQAHPEEDFAETFAVWLTPRHPWRRRYADWPALKKLEYVERLMQDLRGRVPSVRSRRQLEPLSSLRLTLREHYTARQAHFARHRPTIPDRDLKRLFPAEPGSRRELASRFLHRHRGEVRRMVARFTGESPYALERVLDDVIERCQVLDLRVSGDRKRLSVDVALLLTVRTVHFHYSRRNWVAL